MLVPNLPQVSQSIFSILFWSASVVSDQFDQTCVLGIGNEESMEINCHWHCEMSEPKMIFHVHCKYELFDTQDVEAWLTPHVNLQYTLQWFA